MSSSRSFGLVAAAWFCAWVWRARRDRTRELRERARIQAQALGQFSSVPGSEGRRVAVTIAVRDEAANLPAVLGRLPSDVTVLVVDDGSRDGSAEVAAAFGACVVRHRVNLGQGAAVVTGLRACLALGCELVVEMDGDGQHDPADLPVLLAPLEDPKVDLVLGSRRRGVADPEGPWMRRAMLPVVARVLRVLTGYPLTDAMCGYRAFRAASLSRIGPVLEGLVEPQYLAAEMLIRFSRAGLKAVEVPITMRARASGRSSKGLLRYGLGVLRATARGLRPSGP